MALRSKWTVRIEQFETMLRMGSSADEFLHQPILVSLRISGLGETHPESLRQCFDDQSICRWMLEEWPDTPPVTLLATRFNELVAHIFSQDKRVMDVWAGLYQRRVAYKVAFVGLEREITRRQYQMQWRQTDSGNSREMPLHPTVAKSKKASKPVGATGRTQRTTKSS